MMNQYVSFDAIKLSPRNAAPQSKNEVCAMQIDYKLLSFP